MTIPAPLSWTADDVLASVPRDLLVGGTWRPADTSRTLAVEDPATCETIAEVADASPADGLAALSAAATAQRSWARTAPRERAEVLRRAFELTMSHRQELATLLTLEMGRPLAQSLAEVSYGAEFLRWFSEESVRVAGRYANAPGGDVRMLTMKRPVGPCLLITPWNFPLAMATRKVAPAIAAGCTMVLKPAAQTPLTTLAFARIMEDAGLPAGVLNVVVDVGDAEARHRGDVGSAASQGVVHGLDRSRAPSRCRERRTAAALLHGARRQCAVHRLRRRRPRRGRRGGDDRQAAQHGRVVHRGEPLLRRREPCGRLRRARSPRACRRCAWGTGSTPPWTSVR